MKWDLQARSIMRVGINRSTQDLYECLREKGYDFTVEAVSRMKRRMRFNEAAKKSLKVGYLDIESTGLSAPWGIILTWCIKPKGVNRIAWGMIKRSDIVNFRSDREVLEKLVKEIQKYDHIVTYYGGDRHFDLPMIRTRAMKYGIPFPKYGEITQLDLYNVCKKKLRMHSYRLAAICEFLGIEGKTPLDTEAWRLGALGHKRSLQSILEHNKGDVIILEKVEEKITEAHPHTRVSI